MPHLPTTPTNLVLRTITEGPQTHIEVFDGHDLSGAPLERIAAKEPHPLLLALPASIEHLVALDVLEAVLDEEAWLDAIAHVLTPGGTAMVRIPLEGPTAWLDALNLYRYAQDITGLGKQLQETKLKGWHRHYRRAEIHALAARHGVRVVSQAREGNPLLEVAQLSALVWGGMVKGTTRVEESVRSWREDREDHRRLERLGPLSTRLTVTLRKTG